MNIDVHAAAGRIAPHVRRTPILAAVVDDRPVLLKLEHTQLTGAFKVRGAVNALVAKGIADRVITASGGNHGLAVATAARLLKLFATIYVPRGVPEEKARRIEATGADLVRDGEHYAEAAAAARDAADRNGVAYVHAYDDPDVIAGQGTIGLEIAADAPGCDAIAVGVGGGGLAAGVAVAAGSRRIVTVEPEGCPSLHDALAAGRPVPSPVNSVAASALGAAVVGTLPFGILRDRAHPALVSDAAILAARDRLWEELRLAVEPAAAAPFAAWLAGRVPGLLPCVVLSGANTGWRPA